MSRVWLITFKNKIHLIFARRRAAFPARLGGKSSDPDRSFIPSAEFQKHIEQQAARTNEILNQFRVIQSAGKLTACFPPEPSLASICTSISGRLNSRAYVRYKFI